MVQRLTRRTEERRAGVAARDGRDTRHHEVLDEGARNDDGHVNELTIFDRRDELLGDARGRVPRSSFTKVSPRRASVTVLD